ncbi:MAG: acyl-ACP--UDP-N-acetylglucosamine O-acyltransferase [Pirellulales bacterium]|nr:acyl-ACP--UDP-N-acetylglucosamine O-acyltransferase [Pirellulales bacterium]
MLAQVHPLSYVSPDAELGAGTTVGPFAVIEENVQTGPNCSIHAHAVLKRGIQLGADNIVGEYAVLGGEPQHIVPPEMTGGLTIGHRNVFREHVTIHRAMRAGAETVIGDGNLLMVNAHVAHDCLLESQIILANNVMLAGHVEVQSRAYLGGAVGVHQFCRVGTLAMIGGQARVTKDVPPYVTVDGDSSCIVGLNLVGLRRGGFSVEELGELKDAYRFIYRSGLLWSDLQEQMRQRFTSTCTSAFSKFFAVGNRGFTPERRGPVARSIIKLPEIPSDGSPAAPTLRKTG